jgi:sulfoxide reductase catalytic subunit YedY
MEPQCTIRHLIHRMILKRGPDPPSSEITDERHYVDRREFMRLTCAASLAAATGPLMQACGRRNNASGSERNALPDGPFATGGRPLADVKPKVVSTDEKWNTFDQITSYNNFYEFGTGKGDPSRFAGRLRTNQWTVTIDGLCDKPADYVVEDLLKPQALEERVYRLRCVEGWSMVIPWIGVPLAGILQRARPTSTAAFVEFTTLLRPQQMPGQVQPILQWPYTEGLRLDEAMHPLTILAVGLYGKTLLNQNGAPLRLVVPWKYGFKSIKSIVRIRFVSSQPRTAWNSSNPGEYGFYANVNPEVDHPRWSQARERRLPEIFGRRPTLMFNGYGDQVASMYSGMDLGREY